MTEIQFSEMSSGKRSLETITIDDSDEETDKEPAAKKPSNYTAWAEIFNKVCYNSNCGP